MQKLVLFAKRPRLGRVKTRLAASLGEQSALGLHRAFVEDQLAFMLRFEEDCSLELCADGPWEGAVPAGIELTEQGEGDLGERMMRAIERFRGATVVIGADCPTLPVGHVDSAFRTLRQGAQAVVSPAEDGGYVLIGMNAAHRELFDGVPWGTAGVMETTRRRAVDSGLELAQIEGWYDVDDIDGLHRLNTELKSSFERAPATARFLESFSLDFIR
jgi:rSAM/selenodomain-associated transferase 1